MFNFVNAIQISKNIIISSNIFFTKKINFVPLLVSDKVCWLSFALEKIFLND